MPGESGRREHRRDRSGRRRRSGTHRNTQIRDESLPENGDQEGSTRSAASRVPTVTPIQPAMTEGNVASTRNQWYSQSDRQRRENRHPSASPRASRPVTLNFADRLRPMSIGHAASLESSTTPPGSNTISQGRSEISAAHSRMNSRIAYNLSGQANIRNLGSIPRTLPIFPNRTRRRPAAEYQTERSRIHGFHGRSREVLSSDEEDGSETDDRWTIDDIQYGLQGHDSMQEIPSWLDILLPHRSRDRWEPKPSITIDTRPENIVESSIDALSRIDPSVIFDGKITVNYLDHLKGDGAIQTGSDAGGVFKDWLCRVASRLFDPSIKGSLVVQAASPCNDGSRPLLISPHHDDPHQRTAAYRLMGQVIGFALKLEIPLGADLSPPFCRALVGPNGKAKPNERTSSSNDENSRNSETSDESSNEQSASENGTAFKGEVIPGFSDLQYLMPEKYNILRLCRKACAAVRSWHFENYGHDESLDLDKAADEVELCSDIYAVVRRKNTTKFAGKPCTPLSCVLDTLSFEALTHKSLFEELNRTNMEPEANHKSPLSGNEPNRSDAASVSQSGKSKRRRKKKKALRASQSVNVENIPSRGGDKPVKKRKGPTSTKSCRLKMCKTQPLIDHGEHVQVTVFSYEAYLKLLVQHLLMDTMSDAARSILMGICEVRAGANQLRKLTTDDLRARVAGLPTIDIGDWKRHSEVEFEGLDNMPQSTQEPTDEPRCRRHKAEKTVKWFWKYVRSLEAPRRSDLFFWLNGQRRLPHGGMEAAGITQRLLVRANCSVDRLPVAHTCSNTLELSLFSNYKALQKRFKFAVHTERFDIA